MRSFTCSFLRTLNCEMSVSFIAHWPVVQTRRSRKTRQNRSAIHRRTSSTFSQWRPVTCTSAWCGSWWWALCGTPRQRSSSGCSRTICRRSSRYAKSYERCWWKTFVLRFSQFAPRHATSNVSSCDKACFWCFYYARGGQLILLGGRLLEDRV